MEKEKITFEQFCDPKFRREQQMKIKTEAVWVTFFELNGLINISQLAKQYLNKSHSWFSQRLNKCTVRNKPVAFKEVECTQIAQALRDIAVRLNAYADEIDNAKMED